MSARRGFVGACQILLLYFQVRVPSMGNPDCYDRNFRGLFVQRPLRGLHTRVSRPTPGSRSASALLDGKGSSWLRSLVQVYSSRNEIPAFRPFFPDAITIGVLAVG